MLSPPDLLIETLIRQGICSERILHAIKTIPREKFVAELMQDQAYLNTPLPIGHDQTISQPYVVAKMTELLLTDQMKNVLEIGTGSGYQAAVLSTLVENVYTVERILPLLENARASFKQLKLKNIASHYGDGAQGWPKHAPYDGIIVTAAATEVPPALLAQLANHGRLVIPIGTPGLSQQLKRITRHGKDFHEEAFDAVIFVPLLAGTCSK